MADSVKARALRIQRLATMLSGKLDNPAAVLEALVAEAQIGEPQPHLWEGLHAGACENAREEALALAYRNLAGARRLKQTAPEVQSMVLGHAARFFMGIMGDVDTAETLQLDALAAVPDQLDLFTHLEKKYDALPDKTRLLLLYSKVAPKPPKPAIELGGKIINIIVPLTAKQALPDGICSGLVPLTAASPNLLDVLEAHCLKTNRLPLACTVIEQALAGNYLTEAASVEWRRKLIEHYLGDARTAAKAIPHVLVLFRRDPSDVKLRPAVSRLLAIREIADDLTVELREIRRQGQGTW
jgi:hypothetical protein